MKLSRIAFMQPTVDLEVAPAPLARATIAERFEPAPPSRSPAGPGQPFGGPQQTSRLDASLGDPNAATWAQRFATPLRPNTRPHSVLQHGNALLVQAPVWQLFGLDGKLRRAGRSGSSPLAVSAGDRTFRWVNGDGYLVSAPLATGVATWSFPLHLGDGAQYPWLAMQGAHTVVLGADGAPNPEAEVQRPQQFALEVIEIRGAPEVSDGGLLRSAKTPGALVGDVTGDVVGTFDRDAVVLAWNDHLLTVGLDLAVRRCTTAPFTPRAISAGEQGRVYLVVRTPEGPRLWMLNVDGQLAFSAVLPDDAADTLVPPIVAPDHRVFVTTDTRVVAFSPTGDRLWEWVSPDGRPRAMVTADGWLLVAAGDSLGVFDVDGNSASLFNAPGEVFRTAPVLTMAGEIVAATERALVCVGPEIDVHHRTIVR